MRWNSTVAERAMLALMLLVQIYIVYSQTSLIRDLQSVVMGVEELVGRCSSDEEAKLR